MAAALGLLLAGCASAPPRENLQAYSQWKEINDPLEPANRAVFEFNRAVDKVLLKPLAQVYGAVVPAPVKTGLRNVLQNLSEPLNFLNNFLQGAPDRAFSDLGRFVVNSTVGLGGLIDVADGMGMAASSEDFGQTLARWGMEEGPYLMLPLLGPSNPRDLLGRGVDMAADPFTYGFTDNNELEWAGYTRTGLSVVDGRYQALDSAAALEAGAMDFYANIRSAYRQQRGAMIRNDRRDRPSSPGISPKEFEFDDEPAKTAPPAAKPPAGAIKPQASLVPSSVPYANEFPVRLADASR